MLGRGERVVIAGQCQGHAEDGQEAPTAGIIDPGHVLGDAVAVQERRDRDGFFGFFVDHERHAYAAIRMAAATELSPLGGGPMDQVSPIGEGGHERYREPVAGGLAQAGLVLHVVRQMAQGVALGLAAVVRDFFVATGKRNGLETQEADGLGVVQRELDYAPDLFVVDAVHDGGDRHDVHAGFVQVVDSAQLHVKQVADLAVRVGGVADAVELQVSVAQARFGCLTREFR